MIVVEAKKNDFEQDWGQCLAELVAAQRINQDAEKAVYGVVTDGNLWQFGRLRRDVFTKNAETSRLTVLLGCMERWNVWRSWWSRRSRADADDINILRDYHFDIFRVKRTSAAFLKFL